MSIKSCLSTLVVSVVLGATVTTWSSPWTHAATPDIALMGGSGPHQWTQHGVAETVRHLDFAIQGIGFFALQSTLGEIYLTRDGQFTLNEDGFLAYKDTDLLLLSSESTPIQIAANARKTNGVTAKTFRVELDGSIKFLYQDGLSKTLDDRIGIALPARIDFSTRSGIHLFKVDDPTTIFMGHPQEQTRGSLYSSALEVIGPYSYAHFENRFEKPFPSSDGRYLITTDLTLTKNKFRLSSRRTRRINPSDQWMDFSSDDRVYFNGKLKESAAGLQLKWMTFTTDFSTCEPVELTSYLVLGEQRIFTKRVGDCVAELKVNVNKAQ